MAYYPQQLNQYTPQQTNMHPWQQYGSYIPNQPQPQQQSKAQRVWVQGETGAKSYIVQPGDSVDLWDSERQTIYIKSADASGIPKMMIIDYQFRDPQTQSNSASPQQMQMMQQPVVDGSAREIDMSAYATKDDISEIKQMIQMLQEQRQEKSDYNKKNYNSNNKGGNQS